MLTILNREKYELQHLIQNQPRKREYLQKITEGAQIFKKDIMQLTHVVKDQETQLEVKKHNKLHLTINKQVSYK